MGKEIRAVGSFGSEPRKNFPLRYKIDFYGCIILLLSIYIIQLLLISMIVSYWQITVPHEMIVHSPIILNVSDQDLPRKPLACNPYFKRFRQDFLTDEMITLQQVRSADFLALPEVEEYLNLVNAVQGQNTTVVSMSNSGFCEVLLPMKAKGQCIEFKEIESNCIDSCGAAPNVCFWTKTKNLHMCAVATLLTYVISALMTFGLLYDPPPARLGIILHPALCGIFYLLTAVFAVIGLMTSIAGVKTYAPPVMTESYPGFAVENDTGYSCLLLTAFSSIVFALIYFYVAIFAPKYPRKQNRWDVRREKFEETLQYIKDRITSDA